MLFRYYFLLTLAKVYFRKGIRLGLVKVEGVKISPETVVSGEDISGGRVVIKISYFGFHVPTFMTSVMIQAV